MAESGGLAPQPRRVHPLSRRRRQLQRFTVQKFLPHLRCYLYYGCYNSHENCGTKKQQQLFPIHYFLMAEVTGFEPVWVLPRIAFQASTISRALSNLLDTGGRVSNRNPTFRSIRFRGGSVTLNGYSSKYRPRSSVPLVPLPAFSYSGSTRGHSYGGR